MRYCGLRTAQQAKEKSQMKNRLYSLALTLCLTAGFAAAQVNSLTQTTLSAATAATDQFITVASATGINAPNAGTGVIGSQVYVIAPGSPRGETMIVRSVTSTTIGVRRGASNVRTGFPSGSVVLIGQPNWFQAYDPNGSCVTASVYASPWVNTLTGNQWLCSTITQTWVPSWGNPSGDAFAVTAAVASAAGAILPSGPLFHVTGVAAITGFTIPVGFTGGSFSIIPDGIFTTTTAGNIAIASTSVVNKILTFTWDATNAKFVPSY
jgi:hypothetical protein